MPEVGIELGTACMPSELASDRATVPGQSHMEIVHMWRMTTHEDCPHVENDHTWRLSTCGELSHMKIVHMWSLFKNDDCPHVEFVQT